MFCADSQTPVTAATGVIMDELGDEKAGMAGPSTSSRARPAAPLGGDHRKEDGAIKILLQT